MAFQPPPPLLPDLVSSMSGLPPTDDQVSTMTGCFPKQQVNCQERSLMQNAITSTMLPNDDSVVQLMMDCSMEGPDCSSGIQSTSISNWPPATPSSSSSATFSDYTPQQYLLPPPPPSPPQPQHQISQPPQLPNILPSKVVEEFEIIMSNENDKVVLTNSVCLLFRFSIVDSVQGHEVCQGMSASPDIMNRLYFVLLDEQFQDDDLILCYATGNLTNISKFEEGRAAILGCINSQMNDQNLYRPSHGVKSLIRSLRSRDSNVVIFAITAIHNLLLDRRAELQEIAKQQIKHGLRYIVQLLDNQCLKQNYEFKVIVLDCLQILAYGNKDNRLIIKKSGGPYMLLSTIEDSFNQEPTDLLTKTLETASRVLKSLSACPENKVDIIEQGGISILTHCIKINNPEILKTCLWTLRNLSDVINNSDRDHSHCIDQLVERLLQILDEYAEAPCIITCALGILANLTCNNESIKQRICEYNGVELLLHTINIALETRGDIHVVDKEILEPAFCALCHLLNQTQHSKFAEDARQSVRRHYEILRTIMDPSRMTSDDLSKTVDKLHNLIFKPQ